LVHVGSDAGECDERQLRGDRAVVPVRVLGVVVDQVPDAGGDEHGVRRPRQPAELPRRDSRHVGARSTQDGHERPEGELSADPDGRREHVQEHPDGLDVNRKHPSTLAAAVA
jgi:hypothetical protein